MMMTLSNTEYEKSVDGSSNRSYLRTPNRSMLSQIADFIEMQCLQIYYFWRSERNHASLEDIVSFCKSCGHSLNEYDQINLRVELFAKREVISVEYFCNLIPCWKTEKSEMITMFLKKRSDMLIHRLQSKEQKRPKSVALNRDRSSLHDLKLTKDTTTTHKDLVIRRNNSQKYLSKFKYRYRSKYKALAETIYKNKIDYEYGMLLKMSELNYSSKAGNSRETYRAYKSAYGVIKARIFIGNYFSRETTLKYFYTIYKNYEKNKKYAKYWGLGSTQKYFEAYEKKSKNTIKTYRQQYLKNLLVNTVNLTNLLKEQIKIFKTKGIYGSENV